eukprot:scaffold608_cov120-Isochrysis_galbana.AAC.1
MAHGPLCPSGNHKPSTSIHKPSVRMEHPPADARAAPSASAPNDTVMDIASRRNVRTTQRRTTG